MMMYVYDDVRMYIFACLRLFLGRTLEYVCSIQAKRGLSAPPTFPLSALSLRAGWFSVNYTNSTYQSPLLCSPCLKHQTKKAAVLLPFPLSALSLRAGWFSVNYTYSTYQSPLLCSPCLEHQTKRAAVLLPFPLCP